MSDLRQALSEAVDALVTAIIETVKQTALTDLADADQSARSQQKRSVRNARGNAASVRKAPELSKGPATANRARGPRVSSGSTRTAAGTRVRASVSDVEQQKATVLTAAKTLAARFAKGDVVKKVGKDINVTRILGLLVAEGILSKEGDRRGTRYTVQ